MGLGLVTVGALASRDIATVNKDKIKPLLDSLSVDSFSVGVVNSLSIIIIVVGVFIFFVAGLGIYGACCQNKYLLVTVRMKQTENVSKQRTCIFMVILFLHSFIKYIDESVK